MIRDRRALAFLVVWFAVNLLFGTGVVSLGSSDTSIAWQAHVGGFLLGLLALPFFDRRVSGSAAPDGDGHRGVEPGEIGPS